MKKLLYLICIAFVACNSNPVNRQMEEAVEAQKRSDSILSAFKKVNEQLEKANGAVADSNLIELRRMNKLLEKTRDSLKQELDATYKSMDSTLKKQ